MPGGGEIKDAEPPRGESDVTMRPSAGIIGAAVREHGAHLFEQPRGHIVPRAWTYESADAAHNGYPRTITGVRDGA